MNFKGKYHILLIMASMAISSCAEKDLEDAGEAQSQYTDVIEVLRVDRTVGDSDESDSDEEVYIPYDGEEIFDVEFKQGESILYVSQKTRFRDPFKDGSRIYKYVYYDNKFANWDAGFNFQPVVESDLDPAKDVNPNSLSWDDVSDNGSYGNGFALYAMYYPGQEEVSTVATDQRLKQDLLKSDILGAYHSTSALYSRIRFQLYHLMVYFKVNLYVPVYKATKKTGDLANKDNEPMYSGYTAESLIDAKVIQACPVFTVDWAANISSEKSPVVNIPDNYAESLWDIGMYSHNHKDENEIIDETAAFTKYSTRDASQEESGDGSDDGNKDGDDGDENDGDDDDGDEEEIPEPEAASDIRPVKRTWIDISQFLPKDLISIQPLDPAEDGRTYDEVFVYSFSVIIPAQYADFTSQKPGFLQFDFQRPGSLAPKNYFFSSGFSNNSQSSILEPTKGTLQVLNLYLPRKGDEMILVGAEVENWKEMETDMNLPQKDPPAPEVTPGNPGKDEPEVTDPDEDNNDDDNDDNDEDEDDDNNDDDNNNNKDNGEF